jgi:uncharacterized membrane protein
MEVHSMYSKVKVAGHPLHPMLVGFPVTMYTAALVCFAAVQFGADPIWFRIGVYANVAGVITALVAAIPGFIDWAFGVPAGTPAKATGMLHMLANVSALVVFAVNAFLIWDQRFATAPPSGQALAIAAIGVVLTVIAGFLGWAMVQTHHVGVDLTPEQARQEPRPLPKGESPSQRPRPIG